MSLPLLTWLFVVFWKLLYLTQNWYCGRFIQRLENLVYGNDNYDNHITSPNLSTNRTVYVLCVRTFAVHFVKLTFDFNANM